MKIIKKIFHLCTQPFLLLSIGAYYGLILNLISKLPVNILSEIIILFALEYILLALGIYFTALLPVWLKSKKGENQAGIFAKWRIFVVASALLSGAMAALIGWSLTATLSIFCYIFFGLLSLFELTLVISGKKNVYVGWLFGFFVLLKLAAVKFFSVSFSLAEAVYFSFPLANFLFWLTMIISLRGKEENLQDLGYLAGKLKNIFFLKPAIIFFFVMDILTVNFLSHSSKNIFYQTNLVWGKLPLVLGGGIFILLAWLKKKKLVNLDGQMLRFLLPFLFALMASFWIFGQRQSVALLASLTASLAVLVLAELYFIDRDNKIYGWLIRTAIIIILTLVWGFNNNINNIEWALVEQGRWLLMFAATAFLAYLSRTDQRAVKRNWQDLNLLWSGGDVPPFQSELGKIRVLLVARENIFCASWAEKTKKLFYKWQRQGHEIFLLSSNDGFNKKNERKYGVNIIRRGGRFSFYLFVLLYWFFRLRKYFDTVVIFGFFSQILRPMFVGVAVVGVRPIRRKTGVIDFLVKKADRLVKKTSGKYQIISSRSLSRLDIKSIG